MRRGAKFSLGWEASALGMTNAMRAAKLRRFAFVAKHINCRRVRKRRQRAHFAQFLAKFCAKVEGVHCDGKADIRAAGFQGLPDAREFFVRSFASRRDFDRKDMAGKTGPPAL